MSSSEGVRPEGPIRIEGLKSCTYTNARDPQEQFDVKSMNERPARK